MMERIWQVRLPDGSAWVPPDSRPNDPHSSWIYARSTADMFARQLGGEVVEVPRYQQAKRLDREITAALAAPRPQKQRRLGATDRRERAAELLQYLELPRVAREALETAKETADKLEFEAALLRLNRSLPAALWAGRDKQDRWLIQEAEPLWSTEDPAGEDSSAWSRLARDDLARTLAEDS